MLKILFATTEVAPIASVGGIAEYVLGLTTSLLRKGHDVRVAIPSYAYLYARGDLQKIRGRLPVQLGVGASEVTAVHELFIDCPGEDSLRLPVIVIGSHKHFASVHSRDQVYQWPNHEPWIAFSRSIVDWLSSSEWQPDVIHCHDSHTALVPVYVNWLRKQGNPGFASSAITVLTVHNLLNQGIGEPGLVGYAGLPSDLFNIDGFEYYGRANCFKAGLLSADRVNTVSRTYAQEICGSSDFGFGLEGVLRSLKEKGKLIGILNGIDESSWRVEGVRYDGGDADIETVLKAKRACRQRLYDLWGWQDHGSPLIAFRSRWDRQKGVKLLVECVGAILEQADVVIVTWGHPGVSGQDSTWDRLQNLAREHRNLLINPPGVVNEDIQGSTAQHYQVADFFLMPSRYEPCGLAQMECQRYGSIPIVRKTGGLADTVSEQVTQEFASPNGFIFERMELGAVLGAVERAIRAFHDQKAMRVLMRNALLQRNGWDNRVSEYETLYGGP